MSHHTNSSSYSDTHADSDADDFKYQNSEQREPETQQKSTEELHD